MHHVASNGRLVKDTLDFNVEWLRGLCPVDTVAAQGGRDHWGNLAPLLLYGGGLRRGQVVGQSARDGAEPASDPLGIPDLISTIMHTLVDVSQARLQPDLPKSLLDAITAGRLLPGLL